MHIKVNNIQAISAVVSHPLTGAWTSECVIDSHDALTVGDTVSILVADIMEFKGTVTRAGAYGGRSEIRVIGGANGLSKVINGKSYKKPTLGLILTDILSEAGETLTAGIDSAILSYPFPHWCRATNPARRELVLLLAERDNNWRILPNGEVWVGTDDWTDSDIDEYVIETTDSKAGRIVIGSERPTLSPGEVFEEKRIQTIVHMLDNAKLRTEVVFSD
jgi:hypothetical protein